MSRRTEIEVGITVVLALVVLLWGVTWLKEFTLARKVHIWHVSFPQTGGLGQSDEVQVNGIRKGSVEHIALFGDHVVVDLAIAGDVTLTSDSRIAIRNVGLMGEKVIAVDLRTTGHPYSDRDTVSGVYELGMPEMMAAMGASMTSVDHLARAVDDLARRLEAGGDLDKTLSNLRETTDQLAAAVKENRATLRQALADAAVVTKTARSIATDREAQIKRTLDAAEKSAQNMERLSGRLDSLRSEAQRVVAKMDHGDGTLAKLLNDDRMYADLNDSVKSFKALIDDIRKNPRKYINLSIF